MSTFTEPNSPGSMRRLTNRNTNRYSVTALFSMAAEQDADVDDELARGVYSFPVPLDLPYQPFPAQKRLRDLKARISAQSKKNFVLERDVRFLDSRIALLIQNRMALDEVSPTSCRYVPSESLLINVSSKTRSNDTSKTLIQKKATSPTTERSSSIPTSSSSSNQNPVTSPPYAVSSVYPKSIPSSRPSCSHYTETNTRVAKNTFC